MTLPAEHQALLAQIAATPAPSNLADLIQKSDLLKVRIDLIPQQKTDLTNKLPSLEFDVTSALANKNAMDALRVAAYTAYATAYNNAVAQSSLPYSIETCTATGSPAVTTCTTTNHTYAGGPAMTIALNDLFAPLPSINPSGKYFQWYFYQQKTLSAKKGYDQAVSAETEAKNAYDGLNALNTGITCTEPVPAVDPKKCQPTSAWSGAAAILQQADEKGGIR